MSGAVKKRHTKQVEVIADGRKFKISRAKVDPFLELLERYPNDDDLIPAEEVIKCFGEDFGTPGSCLQGARLKENMTQIVLAKKLGIAQNYLSDLETSRRKISVKMAKKLAKVLNIDYRVFL